MSGRSVFDRFAVDTDEQRPVARRGDRNVYGRQLRARTRGWTSALAQVNNPSVALFEPDGVEFAAALMGAWYAGKTVYLPGDALPGTCHGLRAHDVVFLGRFDDRWHPVATPPDGDGDEPLASLDADACRLVIYTSGSSGAPVALPKRLRQLQREVHTLEQLFGADIGDSDVLATVSHQHIYGLLFKILWPLTAHRPFIADSVVYPAEILAQLRRRRTIVVSGPAHLKRLPASFDAGAFDSVASGSATGDADTLHARVGAIFSSGGPLSIEAVRAVESTFGIAPIEVYGSSETGGIAWRQRSGGSEQPWAPLTDVTVRQHEDTIAVRSPHLADDQWHVLADHAVVHGDGRFTLGGRADRIVKIEGKRVSLTGIEDLLTRSGLVSDARAMILTDNRDEVVVVVVPSEDGWALMRRERTSSLRQAFDALLAEHLDPIARPRRWRILDALPLNAVGKATVEELTRLFAPLALNAPAVHVLEHTGDHARLELYVSQQLRCFDGHFTDFPVLPGVAQLDWAVALGREYCNIAGAFARLEAVKFHRVYQPGALLTLELSCPPPHESLTFRYASGVEKHSSGRIVFAR